MLGLEPEELWSIVFVRKPLAPESIVAECRSTKGGDVNTRCRTPPMIRSNAAVADAQMGLLDSGELPAEPVGDARLGVRVGVRIESREDRLGRGEHVDVSPAKPGCQILWWCTDKHRTATC